MNDAFEKSAEEVAAFQRIWLDSFSKMFQASFTVGPNSPPPEILKNIRSGIFQALAQSWDEFMRSPQFLESMKQWMESAINFRNLTNDFLARARNECQAPSRTDVDTIMMSIHHMEKRLLDQIQELSHQVSALGSTRNGKAQPARGATRNDVRKRPRTNRTRVTGGIKTIP